METKLERIALATPPLSTSTTIFCPTPALQALLDKREKGQENQHFKLSTSLTVNQR